MMTLGRSVCPICQETVHTKVPLLLEKKVSLQRIAMTIRSITRLMNKTTIDNLSRWLRIMMLI